MIVRKVVMVCQTYLQLYLLSYFCGAGVRANQKLIGGDAYVAMEIRYSNFIHSIYRINTLIVVFIGPKYIRLNYNILLRSDNRIAGCMGP